MTALAARSAACRPTLEEFVALAHEYTVVPVWREVLADLETPLSAYLKLVGDREGFLLESVERAERWGRFSFLGRDPALTMITRGREIEWVGGAAPRGVPSDRGTLAALESLLAAYRAPHLPELPPFHGGIVGWLGYDTVREIERLPAVPHDDQGHPDAVLSLAGQVAAFDHFRQRIYLIENVYPPVGAGDADLATLYEQARARLDDAVAGLARPLPYVPSLPPPVSSVPPPEVRRNFSPDSWARAVEAAKEHILDGDIFQVVLAQRFDLVEPVDPFAVYRVLRLVNPSPYMYFLRHEEATLVGSSPEPMVQLRDGRVISRPIAGTRRRGRDDEHDKKLAAELVEHPKERAEHVMLVDLARNDVGRVVRFGTERVEELMTLERYSHVMHLTSQVAGELAEGKNAVDVLRATFPAGTVSGAPKVRAMEIIDELEPTKRGPYAGVVGYLDFSGNLDTAIAIRTMVWRGDRATLQAGAGIVADSVPADEDLECANKAGALLTAAAIARDLPPIPPR
ncbi:MAG: anthranilate synthase component I [Acidimicrobiia bacterium]|nr:MAG: anthranilate synthase component I [Acidimicrobiia bacterium]